MTKGNNTLYFTYDAAGNPTAMTLNGETTYYYATNLQGDIIAILDDDGEPVVEYTYDAWGNSLGIDPEENNPDAATLAELNPLRYRGYVYDSETGLYYLQSRYYNPEIGRFINADVFCTTGQGFVGNNMFVYCNNNPILLCDYNGCRPIASASLNTETAWERSVSCAYMKGYDLETYGAIYTKREQLKAMGFRNVTNASARDYYNTIISCGINTPELEAHFLAQCYVEGNLSLLEAGYLDYESAEAYRRNQPYYPYYGAGYIQLTWASNYKAFSEYMNDPLIYSIGPQYVASNYPWSAAGWYWTTRDINSVIRRGGSVADVTRIVNGGYNGLQAREKAYYYFYSILGG